MKTSRNFCFRWSDEERRESEAAARQHDKALGAYVRLVLAAANKRRLRPAALIVEYDDGAPPELVALLDGGA